MIILYFYFHQLKINSNNILKYVAITGNFFAKLLIIFLSIGGLSLINILSAFVQ